MADLYHYCDRRAKSVRVGSRYLPPGRFIPESYGPRGRDSDDASDDERDDASDDDDSHDNSDDDGVARPMSVLTLKSGLGLKKLWQGSARKSSLRN